MCVLEAYRILSSLKNKKDLFCTYKDKPVGYLNF